MNAPQAPTVAAPAAGDAIRPVSFTPPEAERRTRFRIAPWQIATAIALLVVGGVLLFILTARSVRIEVVPTTAAVQLDATMTFELGGVHLLQPGDYGVTADADGYYALDQVVTVGREQNQTIKLVMTPLPGLMEININAEQWTLAVNGEPVTPNADGLYPVDAGLQTLSFEAPRYFPYEVDIEVAGKQVVQPVNVELRPAWADVRFTTQPAGATIFMGDQEVGTTPAIVELLEGEHEIRIKLAGHSAWQRTIRVIAEQPQAFDDIALPEAEGLVLVRSRPSGAGVSLDGVYQGATPIEIAVPPGAPRRIELLKTGYAPWRRSITTEAETERTLDARLEAVTGLVNVDVRPSSALLYVNDRLMGRVNRTIELPSVKHKLEIRADGYQSWSGEITPRPGFAQEVRVSLLTVEQARIAAIKPEITSPGGQRMLLMNPTAITLGASRREPGRRANETIREVVLTKPYYLSTHEVTNAQYRQFRSSHDSGTFEDLSLNDDEQPVANISWRNAAAYCNWLSQQSGRTPAYILSGGSVQVRTDANGYRMPTEAEWAWAARHTDDGLLKFPWGSERKPPDRHGNYADRTATHIVGRIIFGYTDGYAVSTAPGTYAANEKGLFDMGGNVAEWLHDFYEIPSAAEVTDPTGPASGDYHGIRGSSWMHGSVTELRFSYRDYGIDGRPDLGFRIALPLEVAQ